MLVALAPRAARAKRFTLPLARASFHVVDAPLPHPELLAAIPRLRRYARVLAGDWARADDLVQETLARAWEKRRLLTTLSNRDSDSVNRVVRESDSSKWPS